jgi:hypothetical protein
MSSYGIVMLPVVRGWIHGYTSTRNGSDEDEVQNKNVELSKVTCNSLLNIWDCDVYKSKKPHKIAGVSCPVKAKQGENAFDIS